MKNNFYSSKIPKRGILALLFLFCGLFSQTAMAQDTFTWNGSSSNDWATAANWTKTGTAGSDTYPGQTPARRLDYVVINNGGTPVVADTDSDPLNAGPDYGMRRLTITNAVGFESGSTLTISSGATLTVAFTAQQLVVLNGGNIVNNGTLTINNQGYTGTGASQPILLATPTATPGSATVYGYSGSGALSVNMSGSTVANSAAFTVSSLNANTTYEILFNGSTTFTLGTTATCFALRNAGGTGASSLIIGGTGFTLGTVGTPVKGGLIAVGQQSSVTVNSGTTLTMNSAAGNVSPGIVVGQASTTNAVNFTNRGTINILGSSARTGLLFTTFIATAIAAPFNITNEGTINVNFNCSAAGNAPLATGNGGSNSTSTSPINLTNTSTGILNFINTSTTAGTGAAIYGLVASQSPSLVLTNNGTVNLEGTSYSYGNKFSIINNGILNSNSELRSFTAITNNAGGSINFAKTAATATSRQVQFNGLQTADVSGAIGNTYTDGTNSYVVVNQKFSGGTNLVTNVLSSATLPTSGTLTLSSGSGGTTPLTFTSVSVPALNGALTSTTTNSGTINTDTASNLNIISGVTTTATSVIAPGGSSGKGIASFSAASPTILGTVAIQVSGSATAGTDYDQITNLTTNGGFDITGATLDVTGIYTPTGVTVIDIIVANGTGTITSPFATVTGLPSGWAVNYDTVGKVQLMYGTTWTGATSIDWTDASNWNNGVPGTTTDVTIGTGAFQPAIGADATVKSLTLNALLTINSGTLTVTDAIVNNGSLTIANNANLRQTTGSAYSGSGSTTVTRNSNLLKRLDYTMWSSPVSGTQTLEQFSPNTSRVPNRFYTYDALNNVYANIATTSTFSAGSGYLIRMPNDASAETAAAFAGVFTGTSLNNGTVTLSGLTADKFYLVGNPYPSTIGADAFLSGNSTAGTLYFWRKTNGALGSAYASYNGTGAASGAGSEIPNGTIQVGQGFIVKTAGTSLSFTNAMRLGTASTQFFKTKNVTEKSRVWLNLTNTAGLFSQALVGYLDGATLGVDNNYDGKYINDSATALTSIVDGGEYTIQGRPAFDATDVVAIGFKTDVAGDYSIALDHFDGVFATGQEVYLVDSKTGAETNLKEGAYTFNATVGTDNTRFSLKYQKTLKVIDATLDNNSVSVYLNDGSIYINSKSAAIRSVKVFDVQGRLIAEQRNVKANTAVISNLKAKNQLLIVNIVGEDNSEVSKKVMN